VKEKPLYYSIIPADIRYCNKLTANAKILYSEITALSNKEGYCWATNHYFAKLYKKNKMTISMWIQSLEDNGFIKCEIKNNNMRRIYIIGYKKIYREVQKNMRGDIEKSIGGYKKIYRGDIEKSIGLYNTKYNNKTNTVARKPGDGLISENKKKDFSEKCAIRLENVVRSKRKIMRKVNRKQWIAHFREFRNKSGMKKQRISKVLTWYIKHFGEEFTPIAYSAKTFCDKFLNIEDAMRRTIRDEGGEDFEVEDYKEGNVITSIIHYGDGD